MVASFPEFDYTKNRSNKGGCVPSAHKPSRINILRSTLSPKSSADSTLIGKILSFHGSFHSNPYAREGLNESLKSSVKLVGKRSCSASMGDGISANSEVCAQKIVGSGKGKAAKSGNSARNWSTYKAAKSHVGANLGGQNGDPVCHLPQKLGESSAISHLGDLGDQEGQVSAQKTSAISHFGDLGGKEGELGARKCDPIEVGDSASRVKNRCNAVGAQKGNVGTQKGNVGTQIFDSIQLGTNFIKQSSAQNAEGSEITSSNSDYGSNIATCASSNGGYNAEGNHADAPPISENARKISSPVSGAPNFSADNPLYASDNSSNNMRWSSTSCASTDTSSSNSTWRNSCESRISIPLAAPPSSLAKPHKAHDVAWAAIRNLQLCQGGAQLGIAHFKLVRRVGHGDIGSVFLAHLKDKLVASPPDVSCLFAIKVMDKDALSQRNKLHRMHMEKEILEYVDHPFLPTLYGHFDSENYSCLVMDFCPGGDLYALRQKQPGKRFRLIAARFYAAEVLLALEYLHMLGIVYRDLKPENVLVREDGHIMLTDFDLSLKCDVKPQLLKHPLLSSSSLSISSSSSKRRLMRSYSQSSTISSSSSTSLLHHESTNCRLLAACSIDPIISCLSLTNSNSKKIQQFPNQQLSMVSSKVIGKPHTSNDKDESAAEPWKFSKQDVHHSESTAPMNNTDDKGAKRGASKASTTHSENNATEAAHNSEGSGTASTSGLGCQEDDMTFMELVAEPTQARSMSFVGTHEYLAPEIIAGYGHGSPVDWWTFGIFLYELLFGRTPFKGASNDQTLINIIRQHLRFPVEATGEIEEVEEAKSLIHGLLIKDPRRRLGCTKGAAEIKQHAFFKGVNWALIRCTQPPEVPNPDKKGMHLSSNHHHGTASKSHHHFDFF